ncbi:MAG: hypothetical protein WAL98_22735 [Desulfatiglandaceae bacterium]
MPNRNLDSIVELDETTEKGAEYMRIFPCEKVDSDPACFGKETFLKGPEILE